MDVHVVLRFLIYIASESGAKIRLHHRLNGVYDMAILAPNRAVGLPHNMDGPASSSNQARKRKAHTKSRHGCLKCKRGHHKVRMVPLSKQPFGY